MSPDTDYQGKMTLPPIDALIHFRTAAKEYLGLSPSTAYRLIASHDVPIVQLGKKRMIRRSALVALIDRIERESAVAA